MKPVTLSQLCVVLNLGLLSCGFQTHAQEYYKWVDANGVTTYSANPPPNKRIDPQLDPAKKKANQVAAAQTSSSASRYPQVTTQNQKYTAPAASQKVTTQNPKTTAPVQNPKMITPAPVQAQKTAAPTQIKKTAAPVQPAKNPTTNTSQMPKTAPVTSVSNANLATTTETLYYVKSCDGVRCIDTTGKRFNLVAGNTYLAANGAKCTKTGNNMRCSK